MIAALEHRDETFVRAGVVVRGIGSLEVEADLLFRSIEDAVANLLGQSFPRCVELGLIVPGDRVNLLDAPVVGALFPDGDGAVVDRLRWIGNDLALVDFEKYAETGATWTRAVWRIEGEESRRHLADRDAAIGTRVVLGEKLLSWSAAGLGGV